MLFGKYENLTLYYDNKNSIYVLCLAIDGPLDKHATKIAPKYTSHIKHIGNTFRRLKHPHAHTYSTSVVTSLSTRLYRMHWQIVTIIVGRTISTKLWKYIYSQVQLYSGSNHLYISSLYIIFYQYTEMNA